MKLQTCDRRKNVILYIIIIHVISCLCLLHHPSPQSCGGFHAVNTPPLCPLWDWLLLPCLCVYCYFAMFLPMSQRYELWVIPFGKVCSDAHLRTFCIKGSESLCESLRVDLTFEALIARAPRKPDSETNPGFQLGTFVQWGDSADHSYLLCTTFRKKGIQWTGPFLLRLISVGLIDSHTVSFSTGGHRNVKVKSQRAKKIKQFNSPWYG